MFSCGFCEFFKSTFFTEPFRLFLSFREWPHVYIIKVWLWFSSCIVIFFLTRWRVWDGMFPPYSMFTILPMAYSKPSQISKTEFFAKTVSSWKPLKKFAKSSILDVWLGSEYTSDFNGSLHIIWYFSIEKLDFILWLGEKIFYLDIISLIILRQKKLFELCEFNPYW